MIVLLIYKPNKINSKAFHFRYDTFPGMTFVGPLFHQTRCPWWNCDLIEPCCANPLALANLKHCQLFLTKQYCTYILPYNSTNVLSFSFPGDSRRYWYLISIFCARNFKVCLSLDRLAFICLGQSYQRIYCYDYCFWS